MRLLVIATCFVFLGVPLAQGKASGVEDEVSTHMRAGDASRFPLVLAWDKEERKIPDSRPVPEEPIKPRCPPDCGDKRL